MSKLTKQEMFDRAYRGLASQGWKRAERINGECAYVTSEGNRCAWGWVDPSLTSADDGDVDDLRLAKRGLASGLDEDGLKFALDLQATHDASFDGELYGDMRQFAETHNLTIPVLP